MATDRNTDVEDAVKHFEDGAKKNDLSQFIQDLQKDEQLHGPNDKTFETAVTARLHQDGILPLMNIEGTDGKGNLVVRSEKGVTATFDKKGERVDRPGDAAPQRGAARPEDAGRPAETHVTRDDQGRVTKVEYPANGKSQEFTRDKNGDITKVVNEDKESWTKQQDGSWKMDGSDPPITWKGKLYTTDNGDFVKEHIDGRKDIEKADGSTISYDKDKRLSRTEDAVGNLRDFKYDASGNLTEIKGPGKEIFTTTDGGKTWSHNGKSGDLDVKVGPDGSVSFKDGDGRTSERPDGSQVHTNAKDQITQIKDVKGQVTEFGYDATTGKMNHIVDKTGTWDSKDGHLWTTSKGDKWEGKVNVDKEANYWYEADNGKRTLNRPDGTQDVDTRPPTARAGQEKPAGGDQPPPPGERPAQPRTTDLADGRRVTEYPDGFRVADYPDRSQCEINDKGQCTYVCSKEGYSREWHYSGPPPEGKVEWVKGMDGCTWMNVPPGSKNWRSDRGETWKGDVTVDEHGNSHYKPVRGQPFVLSREGQVRPEGDGRMGDAHSRHRPQQGGDRPPQQGGDRPPQQGGDRPPQQGGGDRPPPQGGDQSQPPRETPEQKKQREDQEHAAEERKKGPLIKPEILFPKKGVYNPAAPPGVGDDQPGEKHDGEKSMGEGNTPIDWRTAEKTTDKDGNVTHTYEGELEDSGVMPWNWGDTNFHGSEKWTKDGRLLERSVEYDSGVDLKFKSPDGKEVEVKDVTKVDTKYNPETGNLDTVITSEDGTKYRAETAQDGSVKSFKKVTGELQTDTIGDASKGGNKGNFSPADGQYNPVRPQGIGEWNPGEAHGEKSGIDNRDSKAETNPDGSTTYRYSGELEDSGWLPWNWGDTNFTASETLDKNGNMVNSHVEYNSSVDQKYVGPNGEAVSIDGVKKVDTKRDQNGNYVTEVTNDSGKVYKFTTDANGKVVGLQKPK